MSRDEARWERALAEHREAVRRFEAAAGGLGDEAWARPREPGKWSPAQVAEHLALTYEAILCELGGGEGLRPRVTAWRQRLLRWVVLPHVLFHRRFPVRVVAPRAVRPGEDAPDRAALLARLRDAAARAEREMLAGRSRGAAVTHPYFGRIPLLRALRFCAVHTEHHTRQVETAGDGR